MHIKNQTFSTGTVRDQALLVGSEENSLNELQELTLTAGGSVEGIITHRLDNLNAAHYVGKGKLEELKSAVETLDVNLVIFDCELSSAQLSNLEEILDIKIIDRTQLILDIFSLHADTRESKLQVEKAQLEYMLSRLTGKGTELSRLGGGIGTRGPGETKLETDRRRINDRIHRLKKELKDISRTRNVQRQEREDPMIALAGYTNAGKSTLLNQITRADKPVADQLFATLDSTLRRFKLPGGKQAIITDTVGFIRNLPHQLIASFRATLEEIRQADIILHLIDSSQENVEERIQIVKDVLKDLDVKNKTTILVFNKIDLLSENRRSFLTSSYPEAHFISARQGEGIESLMLSLEKIIYSQLVKVSGILPYEQAGLIEVIHRRGSVENEEYSREGILIKALVPEDIASRLENQFIEQKKKQKKPLR